MHGFSRYMVYSFAANAALGQHKQNTEAWCGKLKSSHRMNTNIKLTQILFNLIVCYCNATTLETETETIKNWPRDVSRPRPVFAVLHICMEAGIARRLSRM